MSNPALLQPLFTTPSPLSWAVKWIDPKTNHCHSTWIGASSELSARMFCECLKLQFVGPIELASPGTEEDAIEIANWETDWQNFVDMED